MFTYIILGLIIGFIILAIIGDRVIPEIKD